MKRGKPNPVGIQAARNNLANNQLRGMRKNLRKRGLIKLPWAARRDSFRGTLRSRRDKYEEAITRDAALTSKKEPETCSDPLGPEAVVMSARSLDRDETIRNAPNADTLATSAVDAVATTAVDVERVACGNVEVSTGVQLSRKCRKSLELLVKHMSQVKAFRTAAQQPYVR